MQCTLNKSTALLHFEHSYTTEICNKLKCGNTIEIQNGMFDIYSELPHVYAVATVLSHSLLTLHTHSLHSLFTHSSALHSSLTPHTSHSLLTLLTHCSHSLLTHSSHSSHPHTHPHTHSSHSSHPHLTPHTLLHSLLTLTPHSLLTCTLHTHSLHSSLTPHPRKD